jgi:hypothetical protein
VFPKRLFSGLLVILTVDKALRLPTVLKAIMELRDSRNGVGGG